MEPADKPPPEPIASGEGGLRPPEPIAGGSGNPARVPGKFDDILVRLRALVDRLEGGNLPLEDGLRFFEEGMDLCRRGADILDRAEKRVEVLLSTAGGNVKTAPLAPLEPNNGRAEGE